MLLAIMVLAVWCFTPAPVAAQSGGGLFIGSGGASGGGQQNAPPAAGNLLFGSGGAGGAGQQNTPPAAGNLFFGNGSAGGAGQQNAPPAAGNLFFGSGGAGGGSQQNTGVYIGGNVGALSTQTNPILTNDDGDPVNQALGSLKAKGAAYGGQIGFDYKVLNMLVIGIRGMWDGTNIKASNATSTASLGPLTHNVKISSFRTVLGKFGVLLNPTVELYGLAGGAWLNDHYFWTNTVGAQFSSQSETRIGYDVGVGLSWMFAPKWDLWVEYDYMKFGNKDLRLISQGPNPPAGHFQDVNYKQDISKILVGINFHFGNP
jgi:outer membrane immunogenic protein